MYTTYLIEHLPTNSVFDYFQTLTEAKRYLEVLNSEYRILCLKGQYKYEGVPYYQITYSGRVFLKQKLVRYTV